MTPQSNSPGLSVGVDIGGTKTDAVLLSAEGTVLEHFRAPTGFGPEAVIRTTVRAVEELANAMNLLPSEFSSIGVGIPGRVDSSSGTVAHAVNLGLKGLELGPVLGRRLGVEVRVENDVNAAAIGTFHLFGLDPRSSMAYLNLGTGLAAGLVLQGALWRGFGGSAGEIGHIPVDPGGPVCPCGQRGCLEMAASGSAIARMWPTNHDRPVHELFAKAASGHEEAIGVRDRLSENIAAAVRILVLTMDVDVVVIGGGLTSAGAPLLESVQSVLSRWASESAFIGSLELEKRMRLLDPGSESGDENSQLVAARGAAHLGSL